jgi:hypothetical protein
MLAVVGPHLRYLGGSAREWSDGVSRRPTSYTDRSVPPSIAGPSATSGCIS